MALVAHLSLLTKLLDMYLQVLLYHPESVILACFNLSNIKTKSYTDSLFLVHKQTPVHT